MARMDPVARRARILEAGRAVALRQGLAATTVRDIAAEMGSSPGLVHHYVDSMDGLLAEVFELVAREGLETTRAAVAWSGSPCEALRAFFSTSLRPGHGTAFQLWLDAWAEAARRPELGATSRRLNIEWQSVLVGIIEDGVAAGEFRCAEPESAAWRLLSLLDGLVLQMVAHDISFSDDDVMTWVAGSAERELGLAPGALMHPDAVLRLAPDRSSTPSTSSTPATSHTRSPSEAAS